jgi:ABC-type transport system substrate-binding protein
VGTSVVDHLFVNTQKPPFDNLKVRQAISRAIHRRGVVECVYGGLPSSVFALPMSRTRTREIDTRTRSLRDDPLGILGHFPQMPVRVLEVAGVAAQKVSCAGLTTPAHRA